MTWLEEHKAKQQKLDNELDLLLKIDGEEKLQKRFFKRFGCINGLGPDSMAELMLARRFHARIAAAHPELHDEHETTTSRCYHVTSCKCGLSEECDSGD